MKLFDVKIVDSDGEGESRFFALGNMYLERAVRVG